MNGAIVYVLAAVCSVAYASFASYSKDCAGTRFALGAILLSSLVVPFAASVAEISVPDIIPDYGEDRYSDMSSDVTEEAFVRGIKLAICEKFDLEAGCVDVRAVGFVFESVSAERISVVLSGGCSVHHE